MDIWKNCYIHSAIKPWALLIFFLLLLLFIIPVRFLCSCCWTRTEGVQVRNSDVCQGSRGQWSVTTQQLLMQPSFGLENRVSDISVETCLFFLSNILLCAGCQRDIAAGPNITRFLLFFQLQMRSCPEKREDGNWHFVFMTAKWRRKLIEVYGGLAQKFKVFMIVVWTLCPETPGRLSRGY